MSYACWACGKNVYVFWACCNKMPTHAEHTVTSYYCSQFLKQLQILVFNQALFFSKWSVCSNSKFVQKLFLKLWPKRKQFQIFITVPKSPAYLWRLFGKKSQESIRWKISHLVWDFDLLDSLKFCTIKPVWLLVGKLVAK